ncbi:MAG: glycosyltransferase family 4 protein [Planctomycetes bacterium]|nr:glycosyltransferase family 4 protein [Planctomycetota bacterium]
MVGWPLESFVATCSLSGPVRKKAVSTMRVLMLGWEFPPYISGGLGTACYGLTRAMIRLGIEILFVLPRANGNELCSDPLLTKTQSTLQNKSSGFLRFQAISSCLHSPYQLIGQGPQRAGQAGKTKLCRPRTCLWPGTASLCVIGAGTDGGYDGNLNDKVWEYAQRCAQVTQNELFDVIHAHDWITFPAGILLAAQTGKPLIIQVHATEFDRSGEKINQAVYDIEKYGMEASVVIIAVSHRTKRIIVERYGISPEKVRVIHNGIEIKYLETTGTCVARKEKTVLFLGRITRQKGPEFFIRAASRVLEKLVDTRFIMAGWGDLAPQTVEQVAAQGLGRKIFFTGFLHGQTVERAYKMADVYVMPSVSEPFGLTALEAIQNRVPVILSKSSGVAELLSRGAMKVDFWDTEQMANKIIALLTRPELAEQLQQEALIEIRPLTWDAAAKKCRLVYRELVEA